jgi:peptidoglycan/LPS O-acetylase OafA/YrhL
LGISPLAQNIALDARGKEAATARKRAAGDRHIGVLDGVRAMSILLVLAGHLLPLGPSAWEINAMSAAGGMSLFFALSGFLICSFLLEEPPVGEFLVKRATRIVPAVTIYLFVIFILIDFKPAHALVTGLYLHNYLTGFGTDFTGHLWSLAVEMHFYAAAALISLMVKRRGLVLFAVLGAAVTALRMQQGAVVAIQTHLRVDEILAGATLALIYRGYFGETRAIDAAMRNGFWVILALWLATLRGETELGYFRGWAAAALLGSALHLGPGLIRRALESGPMRYIATISYSLYIWHFFAIGFGMNEGTDWERYIFKRPISFVVLLALAHASTFCVEKPISRFVRRRAVRPPV